LVSGRLETRINATPVHTSVAGMLSWTAGLEV
jgi:hypothetical protein